MPEQPAHSIWLRPERSGRGPAPGFDRDRLAAAGVALADAQGLPAVTMRAVAEALGAGPASLYRYVATREELVELMINRVNGEMSFADCDSGRWLDDQLALARQGRRVYLDHPWLLEATAARSPVGPNAVAYLEHALASLAGLPATPRAKLEAISIANSVIAALARAELAHTGAVQAIAQWQQGQAEYLTQVATSGHHPHLTAALTPVADCDGPEAETPEQLFDRVLTWVLSSLLRPAGQD
jgi:AcrR family transcriptional regulator